MTKEEKQLLLRDLSARISYGVIVNCCDMVGEKVTSIDENGLINNDYDIDEVKPYLFPLSSMSEEQKRELDERYLNTINNNRIYIRYHSQGYWDNDTEAEFNDYLWLIEWFLLNHFDYRGLIPKGLALDATGLGIY